MDPLQAGVLLAQSGRHYEAHSALPGAPTIAPVVETAAPAARLRGALADALHRAADAVAPAPVCVGGPAH
jgi:hypothetical protein